MPARRGVVSLATPLAQRVLHHARRGLAALASGEHDLSGGGPRQQRHEREWLKVESEEEERAKPTTGRNAALR